ncbi:SDR family NAD(P)-dependent oxidoreductase [Pseudonocardia sp. MH-G8]|uniref:SDR family NAD(P)-dependent oxidoreductase n=1 Tax=Pseudonocardia sp. MH-G8 TaxID=1854588 RepID=UPI000BA060AD|nr:SDR family oxidoreductase [Pseudonocardia sp. MH-G8]OZM81277.1 3-oxoacyl-ACP reductase [Pseudonocardia sp. MH-G8]
MELNLADKVAVVTGGSKGIGLATARTLRAEGARVVVASRKSSAELDALAGPGLVHLPVDLTDPDAPAAVVTHAVDVFGGLDILVNNAGGPPPGVSLPRFSFLPLTDADWREMFEFNLFAVVRAVRAAIPAMLERGGGAIVNVSTVNARQPGPMNVDYASAKAALNNLTKALSEEFAPQGVRVNTVSPGPVRTAWWTEEGGAADILAAAVGADRDAVMDQIAPEMMALRTGRLVDPQEVADVIVLLASARSASTTGADVVVDGGFLKAV